MNGFTSQYPEEGGFGNHILYKMCEQSPLHDNPDIIKGKIFLIGRTYAAAIERKAGGGENFIENEVLPAILESDIDSWIKSILHINTVTQENHSEILDVHHKVTQLFKRITGLEKRSLASKYLHFHQPNAFFIYDSLATKSIRKKLANRSRITYTKGFDDEYAKFVARCLRYVDEHSKQLTPRQLDMLLLNYTY